MRNDSTIPDQPQATQVAAQLLRLRIERDRRELRRSLVMLRDAAQACVAELDCDDADVELAAGFGVLTRLIERQVATITSSERAVRLLVHATEK